MNKKIDKVAVGSRIHSIRSGLGKTLEEFGKLLDPPAAASLISRWERGTNLPNSKRIKKIASLGGISVEFLLNGSKMSIKNIEDFQNELYQKKDVSDAEARKFREINIDERVALINTINIWNRPAREALRDEFFNNLSSPQQIFINDVIIFLNKVISNKQDDDLLLSMSIFFNGLTALVDGQIDKKEFEKYEHKLADTIDKLF